MNQQMRPIMRVVAFLAAATMFATPVHVYASACDSTIPTFSPGEIISADVLNEAFGAVKPDLATTLIGTWSTECYGAGADLNHPIIGTLTVTTLTNISYVDASSTPPNVSQCLFDGSGTFNGFNTENGVTTSYGPTSFQIGQLVFDRFKVLNNNGVIAAFHKDPQDEGFSAKVQWGVIGLDPNCLAIQGPHFLARFARQILAPKAPTNLAISTSGTTVTLTWTDNSSDETSFSIVRKDSLTGAYTQVGTVGMNTTTFSQIPGAGTYWYRVHAANANGTSLGSNVVKVAVSGS